MSGRGGGGLAEGKGGLAEGEGGLLGGGVVTFQSVNRCTHECYWFLSH